MTPDALNYVLPTNSLFSIGEALITTIGVQRLACASEIKIILDRHFTGDWGKHGNVDQIQVTEKEVEKGYMATTNDSKLNKICLLRGDGRILSEYTIKNERIWIITGLG